MPRGYGFFEFTLQVEPRELTGRAGRRTPVRDYFTMIAE